MGRVKIDIYKADRNYYDMNLSTEEDTNDMLAIFDIIKQDADSGNYEALVLKLDFENLFLKDDICKEYYDLLIGDKPYKKIEGQLGSPDYGKDILDLVSERLNITKDECQEKLHNSILRMVNDNKEEWLSWVNRNYKGKCKVNKKSNYLYRNSDNVKFYERDYIRKYIVPNMMYKEFNYPDDLQQLINVQKKNEEMIKHLEKLQSEKKITPEQKQQLKKRIRFNITIWEDINILKHHYRIEINNTNVKEKFEQFSLLDTDGQKVVNSYNDLILDELQINKIKEIAKNVLTNKQLIIFNLYYISELGQKQIADLIGEKQGNISRDLKISLEKIKENL